MEYKGYEIEDKVLDVIVEKSRQEVVDKLKTWSVPEFPLIRVKMVGGIIKLACLILALSVSSNAQSNTTQYSTTTPLNLINAIPEWANYTIPPGVTLTGYFGCPATPTKPAQWSPPISLSGSGAFNWSSIGMISDMANCPPDSTTALGSMWIQEGAIAQTITVENTSITIPALPITFSPNPSQLVCTGATLTKASDGTITITFPPACLFISGNYATGTAGPYAVQFVGTPASFLSLFGSSTAGTNLAQ